MKVSQLLNVMDKDEQICIEDCDKTVDDMELYCGPVREIKKDDPINKMHVVAIVAINDLMCVGVQEPRKEKK